MNKTCGYYGTPLRKGGISSIGSAALTSGYLAMDDHFPNATIDLPARHGYAWKFIRAFAMAWWNGDQYVRVNTGKIEWHVRPVHKGNNDGDWSERPDRHDPDRGGGSISDSGHGLRDDPSGKKVSLERQIAAPGHPLTNREWTAVCASIAEGLRKSAAKLERHKPDHIGVIQIRNDADFWQSVADSATNG